ncbi:MAG: AAA family ATPase, partial [Bacteroidota bacterium]
GSSNPFSSLDYQYKPDLWLRIKPSPSISLGTRPLDVYFTDNFYEKAPGVGGITNRPSEKVLEQIIEYRKKYLGREWASSSSVRSLELEKKEEAEKEIVQRIYQFFSVEGEAIFIPANRILFTSLGEQLPTKDWDLLLEGFQKRIKALKPAFFRQSLLEIIEQKKGRNNYLPTADILEFTVRKIREILKGEYRVDEEGEKIYFNGQSHVRLSLASSGQQEALWILLQLFILILNREKVFLVIEEPEAHLFPQAQKSLVELIALLFNENKSQVLITTHSPYILTSFNNLIYAGNVGKQHEKVSEIIPEDIWLDARRVGAYKLSNGTAEDLMDAETHLMRAEEIDTASESINDDFDAILNLELQ